MIRLAGRTTIHALNSFGADSGPFEGNQRGVPNIDRASGNDRWTKSSEEGLADVVTDRIATGPYPWANSCAEQPLSKRPSSFGDHACENAAPSGMDGSDGAPVNAPQEHGQTIRPEREEPDARAPGDEGVSVGTRPAGRVDHVDGSTVDLPIGDERVSGEAAARRQDAPVFPNSGRVVIGIQTEV